MKYCTYEYLCHIIYLVLYLVYGSIIEQILYVPSTAVISSINIVPA